MNAYEQDLLSGVMTSDTFIFPASLETDILISRLTAVEICTYPRDFVALSHMNCKLLVTTMETALALFPQTSIFFSRHPYIISF